MAHTDQQAIEMNVASRQKWSLLIRHNKLCPINFHCAVENGTSVERRGE